MSSGKELTTGTRGRLQAWMREKGMTQAAAAKRFGYNEATLSRYLTGTYAGDVKAFEVVVEEVLAADSRRQAWRDFYVETQGVGNR